MGPIGLPEIIIILVIIQIMLLLRVLNVILKEKIVTLIILNIQKN